MAARWLKLSSLPSRPLIRSSISTRVLSFLQRHQLAVPARPRVEKRITWLVEVPGSCTQAGTFGMCRTWVVAHRTVVYDCDRCHRPGIS